jgi:TPR repeat protein/DNA polymerase III epsilon subunit-like protein
MLLFFDTETTGTSPNKDHVVQLAWILTDQNGIVQRKADHIIYPQGYTIPDRVASIHGITTNIARREGKPLDTVLNQFSEVVNSAKAIVGHNLRFDIGMLESSYRRANRTSPLGDKTEFCTMKSATSWCRRPYPSGKSGYKPPTLTELHYDVFQRGFSNAHNALADVQACMDCFWKLVEFGVITLPTHLRSSSQTTNGFYRTDTTATAPTPIANIFTHNINPNNPNVTIPQATKPTPPPVKVCKLVTDEEERKSPAYLQTIRRILEQCWRSPAAIINDLPPSLFVKEDLEIYGLERCRFIARAGLIAKYAVSSSFRDSTRYLQINLEDDIKNYGDIMVDLIFRVAYDLNYQYLTYVSWQETIKSAKAYMQENRLEESRIKTLQEEIKKHNDSVGKQFNQLTGLDITNERQANKSTSATHAFFSPIPDSTITLISSFQKQAEFELDHDEKDEEIWNWALIDSNEIEWYARILYVKYRVKRLNGEDDLRDFDNEVPAPKKELTKNESKDFPQEKPIHNQEQTKTGQSINPGIIFVALFLAVIFTALLIRVNTAHNHVDKLDVAVAPVATNSQAMSRPLYDASDGLKAYERGEPGKAVEIWHPLAHDGDAQSQNYLGMMYAEGFGVQKNIPEAIHWFTKAAEQGHARAKENLTLLGNIQRNQNDFYKLNDAFPGKYPIYYAAELPPTEKIPDEAPLCYKFLVEGPEEQLKKLRKKYPDLYDFAISVIHDGSKTLVAKRKDNSGKVIDYFYSTSPSVCNEYQENRLATSSSPADSTDSVDDENYAYSQEDSEDDFKAWEVKAENGDEAAQCQLGRMYQSGQGVKEDTYQAYSWYRKSALNGNSDCQYNLGLVYLNGYGAEKNVNEAIKWFRMAARNGDTDAIQMLKDLK